MRDIDNRDADGQPYEVVLELNQAIGYLRGPLWVDTKASSQDDLAMLIDRLATDPQGGDLVALRDRFGVQLVEVTA